jgi:DNA-binding protein HU-beta
MNKTDLIKKVAASTGHTQLVTGDIVDAVFENLTAALVNDGEKITIQGFGNFAVKERAARIAVKPGTTERIQVPAKKVVKFTPGSGLKS